MAIRRLSSNCSNSRKVLCDRKILVTTLVFISGFIFVYHFPRPGVEEIGTDVEYMLTDPSTETIPQSDKIFLDTQPRRNELSVETDSPNNKQIQCNDKDQTTFYDQRGNFWVLTNYFKATRTFHCDESITYTTHAEYSYLDNLVPLLQRWQGPLSISVYCPGSDFSECLKIIKYLRECSNESELITTYVTFHIFFDTAHMPEDIPDDPDLFQSDCSMTNLMLETNVTTYRQKKDLTYPINVGRMVARDMSTTFYVFPSDIELYPNPNIIEPFLDMIRRNDEVLQSPNPKVFVFSIFEADESVERLPYNKSELISMMKKKKVIPFHKYICSACHRIPKMKEWAQEPIKDGMSVFHVAKREGRFRHWEPIFIGTKFDPVYDIRLNWEGQRDKMTQGFILGKLDYEFHILDNAFLIHRPGIKRKHSVRTAFQNKAAYRQNRLINRKIYPELIKLYGGRDSENVSPENDTYTVDTRTALPS